MEEKLYTYKAKVVSIYDGDTITVDIDLGLNTWKRNEKLRLARINAPEVRGEEKKEGITSRDFLRLLLNGKEILITTTKKGKYGRYIAEVYYKRGGNEFTEVNISDLLVSKNFAEYKKY